MHAWKSSTLLVLAAFAVSLVLLFAKAGMVQRQGEADDVLVSNHIYSPAAADPDLRSADRAERLRQAKPRAKAVATKAPIAAPTTSPPASAKTPPPPSSQAKPVPATPAKATITEHPVPAGHVFYVVAATFSSPENASKGLGNMKAKGLTESFIGTFDEGKFYSVIASTFPQEAQAHYLVKELDRKHGIKAYVYHKKDEE